MIWRSQLWNPSGDFVRWQAEPPLISEGEVIGCIGVSGGTVDEDVAILEAALQGPLAHIDRISADPCKTTAVFRAESDHSGSYPAAQK
ncbi:heme-binding protein [Mesorhizobium australicum]|uniref:heme-binding protein n=1 Tax=Mesorhizobium australicum TaxID=536018 RepID=UPI00333D95CC